MSKLSWNAFGKRYYETGIDRGVLFIDGVGVAWPGMISVSESPTGGDAKPYYLDGIKFLNIAAAEEFEATINAFYMPAEFGPCDGISAVQNGMFVTQQPRKAFGFSYRTQLGNDQEGPYHAYKIHLVYNALAAPSQRDNKTFGSSAEPDSFSWAITTLPPALTGFKPTAHFVIDSSLTPFEVLSEIGDILYGSDTSQSTLLDPADFMVIFNRPYNDIQFTTVPVDSGGPEDEPTSSIDGGSPSDSYTSILDGGSP